MQRGGGSGSCGAGDGFALSTDPPGAELLYVMEYTCAWAHGGGHGQRADVSGGVARGGAADRGTAVGGAQQSVRRELPPGGFQAVRVGVSGLSVLLHLSGGTAGVQTAAEPSSGDGGGGLWLRPHSASSCLGRRGGLRGDRDPDLVEGKGRGLSHTPRKKSAPIFFSCLDARKEVKENQGLTEAGEVWPGTRQTWLASLTPLDARKGTKENQGPTGAGEVGPGTCLGVSPSCIRLFSLEREIPRHTGCDGGSA